MKDKNFILYKSELWAIVLCTLCLQMPDLKIANIKISEILMLAILPFYIKKIWESRINIYFLLFFILFLFKTFAVNLFTRFYINDDLPILKYPYFISISRFIEMITCLLFCIYVLSVLRSNRDPVMFIKKLLFIQIFYCGIFYIFIFLVYKIHLLNSSDYDSLIVYDTSLGDRIYRLKGFFVEGGPFGLFYAFLFTICLCFYKKLQLNIWYLILCIVLIFLASSKAGYTMLSLSILPFLGKKIYKTIIYLITKQGFFIILGTLIIYAGIVSYNSYTDSQDTLEERIIKLAPDEIDPNYMLGRIAASVIVPNMLYANWIQGIGWGNYPLIRNNPAYRNFMPELPVSMWDATGFGGVLDLFLEAGVLLFLIYIFIYYRLIKLINKNLDNPGYIILAFIGPLILGGAIYLFYTWFLLGILLYLLEVVESEKKENNKQLGPAI